MIWYGDKERPQQEAVGLFNTKWFKFIRSKQSLKTVSGNWQSTDRSEVRGPKINEEDKMKVLLAMEHNQNRRTFSRNPSYNFK